MQQLLGEENPGEISKRTAILYFISLSANIRLLMPDWVDTAFNEYAKRLPAEFKLELTEIKAEHRGKNDSIPAIIKRESDNLMQAIPPDHYTIVLDERGQQWSTHELAQRLENFRLQSRKLIS